MNEDRLESRATIPSSLTPPPSSQVPANGVLRAHHSLAYVNSQRSSIFSPPATGGPVVKRESPAPDYAPPTPDMMVQASPDELRSMLQGCIAEHAKLKMEAAHHKLQFNLLSLQADEDAKRASVEHEMIRRQVEALRAADHSRQARLELSVAEEAAQARLMELRIRYGQAMDEIEALQSRYKTAKRYIQQQEDQIAAVADERDMLLNRIRENREHMQILCSPGGMYHAAHTQNAPSTQRRVTPRHALKAANPEGRVDHQENIAMLLQVLSQDTNNSAPTTPTSSHRTTSRLPFKHTRNAQSLSSIPTTPIIRGSPGLLPSVDFIPQSEPPYRSGGASRFQRRNSRESTISAAEDNAELARQALESVAAAASFAAGARHSYGQASHPSLSHSRAPRREKEEEAEEEEEEEEEEEVFASRASQTASEMLRRDPRESFDVASSVGASRDVSPAPDKTAGVARSQPQARHLAGLDKSTESIRHPMACEKRKHSGYGHAPGHQHSGEDAAKNSSPTKKLRAMGGLRDPATVGLGIQYRQET